MERDKKPYDQPPRAMIPVSLETQERIVRFVGRYTADSGKRTSQEFVINRALDALELSEQVAA